MIFARKLGDLGFNAQDSHGGGTGGTKQTPTMSLYYGWWPGSCTKPPEDRKGPVIPNSYLGITGPRSLFLASQTPSSLLSSTHMC